MGPEPRPEEAFFPADLIIKKRDGGPLSDGEWTAFLEGYRRGAVAEYQMAALLMAALLRGMTPAETRAVTRIMMESGERWTWPDLGGPVGDKHSTGGVGDKVSLILAPLVAACGVRVPMVSGRGLGHTGGTLDKLESIPGFRTDLSKADYDRLLADDRIGYAMGGQTEAFAPLDKELYALRDVTGTIESIPLITASIMSKKVAEGLDALVLDVKCGDGAFMREPADARRLAASLVAVGEHFGTRTEAIATDMGQPLGRAVGHALEVREAIEVLVGERADARLMDVVRALSARLLVATGTAAEEATARAALEEALASGRALERFRADVEAQGGDPRVADDPALLPSAPVRREVRAPRDGWLAALPAWAFGHALVGLGGARRRKGDDIDLAVGFELPWSVGDQVEEGAPWAVVHAADEDSARRAVATLEQCVEWSESPVAPRPALLEPTA